METNAKKLAEQSLKQLEQLQENYGMGGKIFANDYSNACVDQIMNKLATIHVVNVEVLNNEFIKLLKVTQLINDSEFAFGIETFKESLISKVNLYPSIKDFLQPKNITILTNRFYNGMMSENTRRFTICQNVTDNNINNILEETQLQSIPLNAVLEYLGAKKVEEDKWKILETGEHISIRGNNWMNWNTQSSGNGNISFVAQYLSTTKNIHLDSENQKIALYQEARKMLVDKFIPTNIPEEQLLVTKKKYKF